MFLSKKEKSEGQYYSPHYACIRTHMHALSMQCSSTYASANKWV